MSKLINSLQGKPKINVQMRDSVIISKQSIISKPFIVALFSCTAWKRMPGDGFY